MKQYRKRFIIITTLLVGVVLFAAFTVQGIISYNRGYNELKDTMEMFLRPVEKGNTGFRSIDKTPPKDEFQIDDMTHRNKPIEDIRDKNNTYDIITVFYDTVSQEISVMSNSDCGYSESLFSDIKETVTENTGFGKISQYNIFYYSVKSEQNYKVAIVSTSHLTDKVLENTGWLALIYILSMTVLFFVNVWLSKIAVRPMEDAIEMERRFVADISHDLKTPVTVVLANNSILKSTPDSKISDQMQWINSTDDAAKNMMKLVDEMLTLSSLESVERVAEKYKIDASALTTKCVLQMESVAYEKGCQLMSDIENGIHVISNNEYFERICTGLIENALKYEKMGGKVSVALKKTKKNAELRVKNQNSFIPKQDIQHIFERFYRSDKSRTKTEGHGLGLPIIKQMAQITGADITVYSDESYGTEFCVTFIFSE